MKSILVTIGIEFPIFMLLLKVFDGFTDPVYWVLAFIFAISVTSLVDKTFEKKGSEYEKI